MKPTVSICVPNLNMRPFLPERFRSIFDQSFDDWELLVYDSYSEDGAWEYICDIAAREPRLRAWQGPRNGAPASWNPCIQAANGEYVFIATSDDTMPADCLRTLVSALDDNPDCDIAHCPLQAVDHRGQAVTSTCEWWWKHSAFARSSGGLIDRPHKRYAPLDGVLHLFGGPVYVSVTQLLIRRELFDRIGFYESAWGSVGDFNWNMRAGLVANTIHVPDTWGGWRVHPDQATATAAVGSPAYAAKVDAMIAHAVHAVGDRLRPTVRDRLESDWLVTSKNLRAFEQELAGQSHAFARKAFLLKRVLAGCESARFHAISALLRRPFEEWVPEWLEREGLGPALVPLPVQAASTSNAIALATRS